MSSETTYASSHLSLPYNGADMSFTKPATIPPPGTASSVVSGHVTVFECPICQRRFASKKYLSMHAALHKMATITGSDAEEEAPCRPLQCRTTVATIGRHGNGPTPSWSCPVCSKTFAQNSNFRNHVRTHSDERPYVCLVCFIGFKERYHLKKHALFKHSGELKEQCRQCGKRFKDLTAVRAHERTHSDLRPYRCDRCNKTFKTSECLWHHENRSKTCGRSPNDASVGGRRRHLAVAATTRLRDRRSSTDRRTAATISPSSSMFKVETTANNVDLIQGLDLDLESDVCAINPCNGGFHWSAESNFDARLPGDQYDGGQMFAGDVTEIASECFIDTHQPFPIDCDAVGFHSNYEDPLSSLGKRSGLDGMYDVDNSVKCACYSATENSIITDTPCAAGDCRFVASSSHLTCDCHDGSRVNMTYGYRDTLDVNRLSSSSMSSSSSSERHSSHLAALPGWNSSLPTAIVVPIQRADQQQQLEQQTAEAFSPETGKCSLPPFETFVPPRRSRDSPGVPYSKITLCRPQQQCPTVTRYLLQSHQSNAPRMSDVQHMAGTYSLAETSSQSAHYAGNR